MPKVKPPAVAPDEKTALRNVAIEIKSLFTKTNRELGAQFLQMFGREARSNNREWLIKRLQTGIQSNAEGWLSQRSKVRIEQLADTIPAEWADRIRPSAPANSAGNASTSKRDFRLPPAGTTIVRIWKGKEHHVLVGEHDFTYNGAAYDSLSKVARVVTGINQSGFAFFKLNGGK